MISTAELEHCSLCPRLCRHVCPVAVGTGREAATPTAIATILIRWTQQDVDGTVAAQAATMCTNCGACEEACGIDRPVIEQLTQARAHLLPMSTPEPPQAVSGGSSMVAIECDERTWSQALSSLLQRGVAQLRTNDHLGAACLDGQGPPIEHIAALRDRLAGRTAVVACHGCASAVEAADIDFIHLSTMITVPPKQQLHHPCRGPTLEGTSSETSVTCCGAGGPLAEHHPNMATDLGRVYAAELNNQPITSPDARCATHLKRCGAKVTDLIDLLLQEAPE